MPPPRGSLRPWGLSGGAVCALTPFWFLVSTAMLLLSGALVSGPYALITTAVSADLVSSRTSQHRAGGPNAGRSGHQFRS